MEDLQKAVESSGMAWEDYKTQHTQQLAHAGSGSPRSRLGHMDIGPEEVRQYYDAHKQEFDLPEQVVLAEIFLSTEGKSPEEIAAVRKEGRRFAQSRCEGRGFHANREALFGRQHREGRRRPGHVPTRAAFASSSKMLSSG